MYYDELTSWRRIVWDNPLEQFSGQDVERALEAEVLTPIGLLALLSPAAEPYLESMAQKARQLTVKHFGKAITLFTPLYLANFCSNQCVYCSFNSHNHIKRKKLSFTEVEQEGLAIAFTGLQHLLLLTGESRVNSGPQYIKACVKLLRPHFASIGLEVYPLEEGEYRELVEAGVDSLTLFQEVYDEDRYREVHPAGPKSNYRFRLDAPERACRAGIAEVTLGALLGLGDWRTETFFTALHGAYLLKNYPDVQISFSVPRMRPHTGSFEPEKPVTDSELVQILLAYRLFLPTAGITISTRESPSLRDALLPLGITRMSAGSLTSVGGYADTLDTGSNQFEIADERSVAEIVAMLYRNGYQPVFSDWVNMRKEAQASSGISAPAETKS